MKEEEFKTGGYCATCLSVPENCSCGKLFIKHAIEMKEDNKTIEDRAKEYLASSECDDKHHINIMADFHKQELSNALPSNEDRETKQSFYSQEVQFSPTDHEFNYYMGFTDGWNAFENQTLNNIK